MRLKPKKSLGQNFLTDNNILDKIINLTNIRDKYILEVGPGSGNLTSRILKERPRKIVVIEKDNDLAKSLNENFKNQLTLINDDILNIEENFLFNEKVTVFGNLPYNISTEILSKWIINLKEDSWFDNLILMFQKEVANRIIAKCNSSSYGRLSVLSHWKLNIKKICDIKPKSFFPRPKIESTLLLFSPKEKFFEIKDPKNLEKVTKVFFNQRRKMLKKPFNQLFNGDQKVLSKLKIDLTLRPQNLDFDTYYQLTSLYENLRS